MTDPTPIIPKTSIVMKSNGANPIYFDFANPDPNLIRIGHVAWGLAHVFRYAGQSKLTVAQHSVAVSRCVPRPLALEALLHDAAEAYVGDMPAPLKNMEGMERYREIENRILVAIFSKYMKSLLASNGIVKLSEEVKAIDHRIRVVERRVLWPNYAPAFLSWTEDHGKMLIDSGLGDIWTPERAEIEYLKAFREVF